MSLTEQDVRNVVGDTTPSEVQRRMLESTSQLLGSTIAIDDPAWQEPSRLPGWTRAHVATHLARDADAMSEAARSVKDDVRPQLYDLHGASDDPERLEAIERGSERGALELQIDLDTSAGELQNTLQWVADNNISGDVQIVPEIDVPVKFLSILRLTEIVVHHVDLNTGFEFDDIADDVANWSLGWTLMRRAAVWQGPPTLLSSTSGLTARLEPTNSPQDEAHSGQQLEIAGTDQQLLAWLTGRSVDHWYHSMTDFMPPLL